MLEYSELSEEVRTSVEVLFDCFLNDPCVGVVRNAKQFGLQVSSCDGAPLFRLDQHNLPKDSSWLNHLDFCEHPNLIANVLRFFFALN